MSRQSQLPPRCPLQKKTRQVPSSQDPQQQKPQSSTGFWGDHSTSDSGTVFDNLKVSLLSLSQLGCDESLGSSGDSGCVLESACTYGPNSPRAKSKPTLLSNVLNVSLLNLSLPGCDESLGSSGDSGCVLESACTYGPNSPRAKSKPTFPDNRMVSALSEYISQNSKQCLVGDSSGGDVVNVSAGEADFETKPVKRHSGQRSRVRKLQYIAELERNVEIFQAIQSELACKVASSLQHRFSLSLENNKLKQQLLRLQHEKMMLDDEYQLLRNKLDTFASYGSNFKFQDAGGSNTMWQTLDLGKLDLN
ncbi:basic leucine zipper 34 [Impatiens glandulifera]|uniref:basic leucine zipper 34 n=1 Tax=Impatiens glandulifera TaxID=253017 RepID=UPI001FB0AA8C|nr:basic leucine zipper 34 [Impatiens glandulifera]